ncbi:MAG: hypothetical protein ACREQP_07600 [Candidatus Binatia bacterium]
MLVEIRLGGDVRSLPRVDREDKHKNETRGLTMEIGNSRGFFLLAGWFGMFLRVRRNHPDSPLSKYKNYIGPRLFRFRSGKRSNLSLIRFYWQNYGADGWLWVWAVGAAVVLVAIVGWRA